MFTLQGIISKSVNNANMQYESLGYISTNISNYNTVGYKAQRFENYLRQDGRIEGTLRSNYSNGTLFATKRPLDIAIDGNGFFPVTRSDGLTAYTREGRFKINSEGYLVTTDGFILGDGIKVPQTFYKLKIDNDGTVRVFDNKDSEARDLGKIPLVSFTNPEGLKSIDGNKLVATKDSGEPFLLTDHQNIKQGNLERSNVNIFECVDQILRLNGSLLSSTKLIKVTDDLYREAINLRQ